MTSTTAASKTPAAPTSVKRGPRTSRENSDNRLASWLAFKAESRNSAQPTLPGFSVATSATRLSPVYHAGWVGTSRPCFVRSNVSQPAQRDRIQQTAHTQATLAKKRVSPERCLCTIDLAFHHDILVHGGHNICRRDMDFFVAEIRQIGAVEVRLLLNRVGLWGRSAHHHLIEASSGPAAG